ncbi:molybdopterin-dependent oxidoreductase [Chelatococcus sp. GCM10030263]|uniref:molybdopterin-dependent oxidoreductase n=1 Tax=Chelatococcus sp. GCM10030263 TaxID=3273387 RepID=UPI00361D9C4B
MRSLLASVIAAFVLAGGAVAQQRLPEPTGPVLLTVSGKISVMNVGNTAAFDRAMLEALPRHQLKTSTVWTDGVKTFDGVLLRDVLARVGAAKGEGTIVKATALNDYSIDIAVADFDRFDVLLAWSMDGERLTVRDKGPLWIVYPRDQFSELHDERYDQRWAWQLNRLEVK